MTAEKKQEIYKVCVEFDVIIVEDDRSSSPPPPPPSSFLLSLTNDLKL